MIKFIDLFCGIGGFHLAMRGIKSKCVFASEWDKNCQDVYEKNFKIKVINKDIKINNILNSTSFNNLQKLENLHGFNESIKEKKFFAVGQKNQWKSELEQNQIKIIEDEFGLIMKKLKYKVHN